MFLVEMKLCVWGVEETKKNLNNKMTNYHYLTLKFLFASDLFITSQGIKDIIFLIQFCLQPIEGRENTIFSRQ